MKNTPRIDILVDEIKEIYKIVGNLEKQFPGRPFTPDGHLVGSIGEVLASYYYELDLLPPSYKTHDAKDSDGRMIQIKATQGDSVGLRSQPEHLLVIKILKDGSIDEIYNGPGSGAWNACGTMQSNGQRSISLNKLRKLMESVGCDNRIIKAK